MTPEQSKQENDVLKAHSKAKGDQQKRQIQAGASTNDGMEITDQFSLMRQRNGRESKERKEKKKGKARKQEKMTKKLKHPLVRQFKRKEQKRNGKSEKTQLPFNFFVLIFVKIADERTYIDQLESASGKLKLLRQ